MLVMYHTHTHTPDVLSPKWRNKEGQRKNKTVSHNNISIFRVAIEMLHATNSHSQPPFKYLNTIFRFISNCFLPPPFWLQLNILFNSLAKSFALFSKTLDFVVYVLKVQVCIRHPLHYTMITKQQIECDEILGNISLNSFARCNAISKCKIPYSEIYK